MQDQPHAQAQSIAVAVVPFPAQGHLNQLLHFALHLSSHGGLSVHFAASSTHNRQAKSRLQGWDPNAFDKIRFHDLPFPSFASPPSDPNSPNKFPSHLMPAFEASLELQAPLSSLFRSLSTSNRRLIIVHDPFMSVACSGADELPNAEAYGFQCASTSCHLSLIADELQNVQDCRQKVREVVLTPFEDCIPDELLPFFTRCVRELAVESGTVMNTCREVEGEFIELMARVPRQRGKKLFAIGPMNPVDVKGLRHECAMNPVDVKGLRHECLEWLDKQPAASVVYVSFGSTLSISDEQIEQLAVGLRSSGQGFIWVLRDADRGDIFADDGSGPQRKLLSGFDDSVRGVGLVVREWAPQLEILGHPSTGAFVSHCGWNSCMESLSMGVPIIAWPMHSDQPANAMLVTEYLKVGVRVRDWDRRKEVVSGSEIERSIERVMVNDEGKEIRKRAKSMGEEIRHAVSKNGSSRAEFNAFVDHITRS